MTTLNTISEVGISNMALARMGSTQRISSFTDGSNEAAQCGLWYPQDRDSMLNDFPFPWSEAYAVLDQVAGPEIDNQVANAQWARSYRYPPDCLKMRRIVFTPVQGAAGSPPQTTGTFVQGMYSNRPWMRIDGDPYPITYGLSNDSTGRLICTDAVGVPGFGLTAVYTQAVSDPSQFAADFADALAWRLAADLAMALGFDSNKRQYCMQEYDRWVHRTRASLMNELSPDWPIVRYQSETVRARWNW